MTAVAANPWYPTNLVLCLEMIGKTLVGYEMVSYPQRSTVPTAIALLFEEPEKGDVDIYLLWGGGEGAILCRVAGPHIVSLFGRPIRHSVIDTHHLELSVDPQHPTQSRVRIHFDGHFQIARLRERHEDRPWELVLPPLPS